MDTRAKTAARVLLDLMVEVDGTPGGVSQSRLDDITRVLAEAKAIDVDTATPGQIVVETGPLVAGVLMELRWLVSHLARATGASHASVIAELRTAVAGQ